MKRILILAAISLFLCSTASAFQGGGGEPTKKGSSKKAVSKKRTSGTTSANTASPRLPSPPAARQGKVRVGVFMWLTGVTASFGISSTEGIRMAADEVNVTGGINGKQIELLVRDDRSSASEAATIVTNFVTQDQVHAILGEVASSRSIAAAPIAQNGKIPMLTPSSTNPEVTKIGDYIFRSCLIDPVQGAAIAQFGAKSLNAKRGALMVDRKNDYSTGLAKVIKEVFTRLGGQIVMTQYYQDGDQDFTAQITSIKAANPDIVFVPGYYHDVGLFAKQARDKGVTAPLLGGDGWDSPSLYKIGGAALNGSYFSNHYSPDDTARNVQKFVKDYKARYGTIPDALAATAYDAARIMFDAIKRADSLDGTAIRDALATSEFPGLTGKVTFNKDRDAIKPIVMIKIEEGGKFVVAERVQVDGVVARTQSGESPSADNTTPATSPPPTNSSDTYSDSTGEKRLYRFSSDGCVFVEVHVGHGRVDFYPKGGEVIITPPPPAKAWRDKPGIVSQPQGELRTGTYKICATDRNAWGIEVRN